MAKRVRGPIDSRMEGSPKEGRDVIFDCYKRLKEPVYYKDIVQRDTPTVLQRPDATKQK